MILLCFMKRVSLFLGCRAEALGLKSLLCHDTKVKEKVTDKYERKQKRSELLTIGV